MVILSIILLLWRDFFSSLLRSWNGRKKERKKNERKRELSNTTFSHPLDFLRLTCITRERDASSCLVLTLSLFLFFYKSGALLYELTKSCFPLLFLSLISFDTTTHNIMTTYFSQRLILNNIVHLFFIFVSCVCFRCDKIIR